MRQLKVLMKYRKCLKKKNARNVLWKRVLLLCAEKFFL